MELLTIAAPPLLARGADASRAMATRVAYGELPSTALRERARAAVVASQSVPGRVESGGAWSDASVHTALATALGDPVGDGLRTTFEWYLCRGAFFHNDAHYPRVLFGVWYIDGPQVDVVFPRAGLRLAATPGKFIVFDPFEIHGVLPPGASEWRAGDDPATETSAFLGFEIELNPEIEARFGIGAEPPARVLSSQTRIDAMTGAFD